MWYTSVFPFCLHTVVLRHMETKLNCINTSNLLASPVWSLTPASLLLALILSPQQWGNKPVPTFWSIGIKSMNHTQASKPASTLLIHWCQQCEVTGRIKCTTNKSVLRSFACSGKTSLIKKWSITLTCVKHAEAMCLHQHFRLLATPAWSILRQLRYANALVLWPHQSETYRDNKIVSEFPSLGFTSVRHTEVIRLYEHCLHHKCAGQRRSPLHGEGKKIENAQHDGVEWTRFRWCHRTAWWLHEALGINLRLLDPGIGQILWWFPKKKALYVLLGGSLEVGMHFWMPSVHNPPTLFTVTYVYLHYTDLKPFEVLNTAKNRLEILCTTDDYSLPLFNLPKSCINTR